MITHEHLSHVHKQKESFRKRLEAYKEKLEGATTKVVRTLEVSAGAAAAGIAQGKMSKIDPATGKIRGPHLLGVPLDLAVGLGLNLAGYLDAAGNYSEHLNNFGDGFLAAYVSNLAFGMGQTWASTGKLFGHAAAPAQLASPVQAAGGFPGMPAQAFANMAANMAG